MVLRHLDPNRYEAVLYSITKDGWSAAYGDNQAEVRREDFAAIGAQDHFIPDVALVMIHGTPGENGVLQGYFDLIGLPYTTGNVLNLALTFNKGLTTMALRHMGLPVAKGKLINREDLVDPVQLVSEVGMPCFVKPNQGGSSLGMTKVKAADQLLQAIEKAFEIDDQVLVESFLQGREVTCGVIPWHGGVRALPPTEIISENEFFDFAAKYEGQSQEVTPAPISEAQTQSIQSLAERIYMKLRCRGMVRVDFMIVSGSPHVIEVNTVPGFSEASILPQQAAAADIPIATLLDELIRSATLQSR